MWVCPVGAQPREERWQGRTCARRDAAQPAAGEAALVVAAAVAVVSAAVGAGGSAPLGTLPWAQPRFGWRGGQAQDSVCSQAGPTAPTAAPRSGGCGRPCEGAPWHCQSRTDAARLPYLAQQARSGRSSRGCSTSPRAGMRSRCGSSSRSVLRWHRCCGGSTLGSLQREMLRMAVCPGNEALTRDTDMGTDPQAHPTYHPAPALASLTGAGSTCGGEEAGPGLATAATLLCARAAVVRETEQPGGTPSSPACCRALACFAWGRQGRAVPASPWGPTQPWGASSSSSFIPGRLLLGQGGQQLHQHHQECQEEGVLAWHRAAGQALCCWADWAGFKPSLAGERLKQAAPSHGSSLPGPWEHQAQTIQLRGDSWAALGSGPMPHPPHCALSRSLVTCGCSGAWCLHSPMACKGDTWGSQALCPVLRAYPVLPGDHQQLPQY